MSAHHDTLRPARTAFGSRALDHFKAAFKAFAATLVRRKAVADLARMDDHALADMGLTRADIDAVNRWSLWGDPTQRLADAADERNARQG